MHRVAKLLALAPLVLGALTLGATRAAAQPVPTEPVPAAEDTARAVVLSGHGLMYLNFDRFYDPGSTSEWAMADAAFGGGASLHVEVERHVWLGVEGSLARTHYERTPQVSGSVASGSATVGTLLLNGRLSGGGLGGLGRIIGAGWIAGIGYISGGAGLIRYQLEDLDDANVDLLFSLAGGLEYMSDGGRGVYLELKRFWAFHERDGVESGTTRHSRLDIGFRAALR